MLEEGPEGELFDFQVEFDDGTCLARADAVKRFADGSIEIFEVKSSTSPAEHIVDAAFREALHRADLLIPDGVGIVLASRFNGGAISERVTGFDLFQLTAGLLAERKVRMMFLGSSEDVLATIRARVKRDYPGVTVATYSPPYKAEFSAEDNAAMHAAVNAFRPDVLWVGMTAPKQEKWVEANRPHLQTRMIGSIGAVFDFYAGRIRRPGKMWQKLGLEWLPRLVGEPRRLWRRMGISAPLFVGAVVRDRFRRK